jgi:hypothetical protein
MNTETETTPAAPAPVIPTDFPESFDSALADLTKTENNINKIRAFAEKWKAALLLCESWSAGPAYKPSITIRKGYGEFSESFDPKKIARAFGADGWMREKNSYTCGQIDWKKTVDEVELEISGAEHMAPKLIEQVKL